jgi:hypothetical protein
MIHSSLRPPPQPVTRMQTEILFNFRDRYYIHVAYRDHAVFPRVGEIPVVLFRPLVDHHSLVHENNIICPVECQLEVVG